ncbi:putative 2OG-Fe(II) oxygenase [Catenovulum sp. 2E275]|uniref:2OG-Fe(II) oxygenase family protein n=1 Tax=Catenovulum sp. 2E275 TaxID=2980497 RepID=UPI0021D2372E|nr:putative 2OG-Fe(II) oxygenase [Catenovulum sp. 2E275]MCU4675718.1 putative 2OG-Fe(II) oxygenase [Catenovulum sp. 2E275]
MMQSSTQQAYLLMQQSKFKQAIALLQKIVKQSEKLFDGWKLLGFAYHEIQSEMDAMQAFKRALAIKPNDYDTALAYAQSRFYCGLPAVTAFEYLDRLKPGDLNATRGLAMALAAEGDLLKSHNLLNQVLKQHPTWLEGHKLYAQQQYTQGDLNQFTQSYQQAINHNPNEIELWLGWFRQLAQLKQWQPALDIIERAENIFGEIDSLKLARLFVASESGQFDTAQVLFQQTKQIQEPLRDMALLRSYLKQGLYNDAEKIALMYIQTAQARVFWPYLSLIWRLTNADKSSWLDGSHRQEGTRNFIQSYQVNFNAAQLSALKVKLEQLHTAVNPFAQQSVRKGTQTDQNLFLRHEPIIQKLKIEIQKQVKKYISSLPAHETGHPLLGVNRNQLSDIGIRFSGSWSVKLNSQGFNVSHTHPMGWISSALYVDLPKSSEMGNPPAGYLQFGTPPPELNLNLSAHTQVKPEKAKLVLFPSTMWHSTVPFDKGQRLVVAFDVRP